MMQLWRIHIRPGSGDVDPAKSYAFCLRKEVIGVGWGLAVDGPLTLEQYVTLCDATYPRNDAKDAKAVVRLLASMSKGDLVWMRSTQGIYHLCQVVDSWQYRGEPDHRAVDVINTVNVEIAEVGLDVHVPGKVIAAFMPARVLQRINDDIALAASVLIWNKVTDHHVPLPSLHMETHDIFSLISRRDCEDLISVYLQTQGWVVYPARRRPDMWSHEFVLRHKSDWREAVVQVKTGDSAIDLGALPSSVDVAWVFQPNGLFVGRNPKAAVIERQELLAFISANPRLVPDAVADWAKFCRPLTRSWPL